MATKIYGASDDLVEFEGDVTGEANFYNGSENGLLIICSDGTILTAKYGDDGIWQLRAKYKGPLFDGIKTCSDPDADTHSDVADFKDGLKFAYVADEWEKVK